MSTDYYLACEEHRQLVPAAQSVGAGNSRRP